ncbi:MAG: hypothetical protein D6731_10175, partial [Planctomycetota bacterium]
MRLIDISPPVDEGIAVWPGDVPYTRRSTQSLAEGDTVELSAITTTLHLGAHADAPSHYALGGASIAERPLAHYYGPCEVVAVGLPAGERIRPEHLPSLPAAPRVLFRTGSYPDPTRFERDFNSLSPELIEALAARGCVLVGIDTPSVDPCDDKVLETHQALARHDVANLEGLVLAHV